MVEERQAIQEQCSSKIDLHISSHSIFWAGLYTWGYTAKITWFLKEFPSSVVRCWDGSGILQVFTVHFPFTHWLSWACHADAVQASGMAHRKCPTFWGMQCVSFRPEIALGFAPMCGFVQQWKGIWGTWQWTMTIEDEMPSAKNRCLTWSHLSVDYCQASQQD